MLIVIAPDSFKESLSAAEVAACIREGFEAAFPQATCITAPMADGGEGTVEAMVAATAGRIVRLPVTGPLGHPVDGFFGVTGDGRTAIVEMAAAAGLALVPPEARNPLAATTFGVGELIGAALDAGAGRLIVALGGSATNDGGAGMIQALGGRLLDAQGQDLPPGAADLHRLDRIDLSGLDRRLCTIGLDVACDVDNPLVGPEGASAVFGPQKGATPVMVEQLDRNLGHYAKILERDLGVAVACLPGGGAAGGLGAALVAIAGARLRPGVEIVAEAVGLEAWVAQADLVITGEGRMDGQSVRGKTPVGVARIARAHGKPVIGLAGSLGPGAGQLADHGIDALFSVLSRPCRVDEALIEAADNLRAASRNLAAALRIGASLPYAGARS